MIITVVFKKYLAIFSSNFVEELATVGALRAFVYKEQTNVAMLN